MEMQQLGFSVVLLLLWGTFLSSEGLDESQHKSFDWTKVFEDTKDVIYKYYRFYKYFRYALDVFVGPDGSCQFHCPRGGGNPFPRSGHKPSSNGCGSHVFGLALGIRIPLITSCCDQHDHCYDTCGRKKRDCDDQFHSCLENICNGLLKMVGENVQACDVVMSLTFEAVMLLGCESYLASQQAACVCPYSQKTDL